MRRNKQRDEEAHRRTLQNEMRMLKMSDIKRGMERQKILMNKKKNSIIEKDIERELLNQAHEVQKQVNLEAVYSARKTIQFERDAIEKEIDYIEHHKNLPSKEKEARLQKGPIPLNVKYAAPKKKKSDSEHD